MKRRRVHRFKPSFSYSTEKLRGYDLHTDGFEIITYSIPDEDLITKLQRLADDGYIIFNDDEKGGDDKRSQKFVNLKYHWTRCICVFLRKHYPHLTPSDMVVLKSEAGCGKQLPHCDYEQDLSFATCPDNHVPLGCVACFMENSTIDVWPRSHRLVSLNDDLLDQIVPIKRETIKLNPGEMLIFRGDLVHAGSSYKEDNYRLHIFLDSDLIKRRPNTTHFMNNVDYIV